MRGLLLDLWREHGFGVLLVTHDVDEAVALADRVLVLDEGRVVHTLAIDDAAALAVGAVRQDRAVPRRAARQARRPDLTNSNVVTKGTLMSASTAAVGRFALPSLAMLVGLLAGCVSRRDSSGAQQAPATVPLSELSGVTLQVGDQKGGTESLLRAAGALDRPAVQGGVLHVHVRARRRSRPPPRARSTSRSPATRRRSSVRRPTRR